ncbi:MAG TPA: hypothetical protein VMI33_07585 [Streptosporangiaceae bacterium]|nr:hypothetical protein [Streptosporangiaceae bacterium]
MPDEIDVLRRFRDETPGPSTDAWLRARAAIAAARSDQQRPARARGRWPGRPGPLPLAAGAAVAAAVAGLLVVLLPGPPAIRPGGPIRTTAYVTRVEHALTSSRAGNLVGYARTVLPPGSRIQLQRGNMSSGPGVSSPLAVAVTVTWSYHDTSTTIGFAPGGQRVFAAEISPVPGGTGSQEVAVFYGDETWWRATTPAPGGPGPAPTCGHGIQIGPGGWRAFIRFQLRCGNFRAIGRQRAGAEPGTVAPGRQRVDGVSTLKLSGANGTVLWVSPATYLPVRVIVGGRQPTQIDFRWLSPTRANLAALSVTVPAGFRPVEPP